MKHAAELDLLAYEDPVFYDRLERARVQATDRLGMIQSVGRLLQQTITTVSLCTAILFFSPWLLLLLVVAVIPAFLGESHFAFLGYEKNFRQTPVRRELDYLRVLGGSREAAKELKLFGLKDFLLGRFTKLSDEIYRENVELARRRLMAGSFLSVIGTAGYYAAYVVIILRTVSRQITIGRMTFFRARSCRSAATSSRFSPPFQALPTRRCSSPICWLFSRWSPPFVRSRRPCLRLGPSCADSSFATSLSAIREIPGWF
jgi:ATP-binding cassette subfamily B protein